EPRREALRQARKLLDRRRRARQGAAAARARGRAFGERRRVRTARRSARAAYGLGGRPSRARARPRQRGTQRRRERAAADGHCAVQPAQARRGSPVVRACATVREAPADGEGLSPGDCLAARCASKVRLNSRVDNKTLLARTRLRAYRWLKETYGANESTFHDGRARAARAA